LAYKPIFLLADSQLLFSSKDERFCSCLIENLKEIREKDTIKATYLGASNGDDPVFYHIFVGFCQNLEIDEYRMIPAKPSEDDYDYFEQTNLILLAGGDAKRGWDAFVANGLDKKIIERYTQAAILIGISAGAIQLAQQSWYESANFRTLWFPTFRLVPLLIDVHDEPSWERLQRKLLKEGKYAKGIGISKGNGAIYHPDGAIEAIKHSIVEFSILPKDEEDEREDEEEEETISYSLILPENTNSK
jgi:peptidase E